MKSSIKDLMKIQLSTLVNNYQTFISSANKKDISEETIRMWINSLLEIFNWDVRNTSEILQERVLSPEQKERLKTIDSTHSRPDYILINGQNIKSFIDAKDLSVNVFKDKATAFQVRSYGWSANTPCSFATNFEQLVIFDCRFKPEPTQSVDIGAIKLHISEYIEKFDLLFEHLYKDNIKANKLEEIYALTAVEGNNKLDDIFNTMLTSFRLALANSLLANNDVFSTNVTLLNYYVQVILDRIIFIRVCESRGIELLERLKTFKKHGFWNTFKDSCYMEFYNHYDGAMFERDAFFGDIVLPDTVFENFIDSLYYPYPYKFDVIPVKVIAQIYEDFLSKQLIICDNEVCEQLKSEYVKEKGAIATPQYIVDAICKNTINLEKITDMDSMLKLKILDPACGSGIFLISCFEMLCKKAISLFTNGLVSEFYKTWFVKNSKEIYLTVDARREIIKNCLFGIDIDELAVEVAKMSLALKIIDNNNLLILNDIGVFGDKILREIHSNIRLGNTLVNTDIKINTSLISVIKPFDFGENFRNIFVQNKGFDYIVGNPPYVETKHYKLSSPEMHKYIKEKYDSFEGKADLSVIFIEKCLTLLNTTGKLGFIVQKRFFKTSYGKGIRKIIASRNLIDKIIDFKTDKLFNNRITYVAIMVVSKSSKNNINYQLVPFKPLQIKTCFENDNLEHFVPAVFIPSSLITEEVWAFESFKLLSLIEKLKQTCGVLGDFKGLAIKDGIQSLWKKAYHITEYTVSNGYVIGLNGFQEEVKLELSIVRPVIYNDSFYCYKVLTPKAYTLFPYRDDNKTPVSISEMEMEFPEAYNYLMQIEERIKSKVQHFDNDEYWHRFTREHNHETYRNDKIIFPMTAKDTIATYSFGDGVYMDNANVWFIKIDNANISLKKAVCAMINSTVFSVLSKAKANPQSGGYYKLNKQFLLPVPFPSERLHSSQDAISNLALVGDEISQLQEDYLSATPNNREVIGGIIDNKWRELDRICYSLYRLSESQIQLVESEGRTVSRLDLLKGVM